MRGNTDGRLDMLLLDLPHHDLEILDTLSRDGLLSHYADQVLVATSPTETQKDAHEQESELRDLSETMAQLSGMAHMAASHEAQDEVLEEMAGLEHKIAHRDAHDSRVSARRVAHLAHLLHSNKYAVFGREHAVKGTGSRSSVSTLVSPVTEGFHFSLASRDFLPF